MVYKQKPEDAEAFERRVLAKIEVNGHVYRSGKYENKHSTLVVWCPTHDQETTTTFSNYERCRTGLLCCGRASVSKQLKNRQFSDETLAKMQQSAFNRPSRGGKPRRWRETSEYKSWRNLVIQAYNGECAVTGARKVNSGDLDVHHLNSARDFPSQALIVENGILLHKDVHKQYHLEFNYGNSTIEKFQEFLFNLIEPNSKPISSQANSGGLEGLETRAYDPERVKKLHERLEGIKAFL